MAGDFLNSFQNGMTSDMHPSLQPEGTYRYMKNCSLISQNGNDYVIRDCLGNVKTFNINIPYLSSTLIDGEVRGTAPMPIGFISFPGTLVVLYTNNETETGGYGGIGKFEYLPYGEGIRPLPRAGQDNVGFIPLYHHIGLNFTKLRRIDGFAYPETESRQRIYWTDDLNEPKVFNIADPIFTTYFPAASNVLVNGKKYMVLEGVVQYAGTRYAPGIPTGNIFTAVTAFGLSYTNITGSTPTPKVIEYYDVSLLNFTPDSILGNIQFYQYGTGSVLCGSKVYFYRLSLLDGSYVSSWSHSSSPIFVGTVNDPLDVVAGNDYQSFVGAGTATTQVNSQRSVQLTVDNIDTRYGYIEIAAVEYDNAYDVPRSISIVTKTAITGSSMVIEHTGTTNLGNLTLNDLTTFPSTIKTCKSLTTDKNYIFLANIQERIEFNFDTSAITVAAFNYPLPAMYQLDSCSNPTETFVPPLPVFGANPSGAGAITPFARYHVYDAPDNSNRVEYPSGSGTFYNTGDVFTGATSGATTATFTGTAKARPCVTTNRYKNINNATPSGSTRVENIIEISNAQAVGFWDYREPAVANHCEGYFSNELYRVGIQFWDKKGKPFFVKDVADFRMPTAYSKGGILRADNTYYSINASGLKIGNIILQQSIIDQISGFSIVRAVRVKRVVAQGLVTQVTTDGVGNYFPSSWVINSDDARAVASKSYMFLCPDDNVEFPFASPLGSVNGSMEEVCWEAPHQNHSKYAISVGAIDFAITKFVDVAAADSATPRTGTVTTWQSVLENGNVAFNGPSSVFQNKMAIGTNTNIPDTTCIGSVGVDLSGYEAVGGKKIVFNLENDFPHYNTSDGYTSTAANGNPKKIVMNFVNPSALGYGAPGDTAYISTGHFQPITDQVLSDTSLGGGLYKFDDIEVFGGDCFTCVIDYGYGLWDVEKTHPYSYGWFFPCECNTNYYLRRGRRVSNVGMYHTGIATNTEIVYLNTQSPPKTRLEDFQYNRGYSTEGQAVQYPNLPANYIFDQVFKERIRFAGPKIIGEIIDSFRTFLVNDYRDLNVQAGQINKVGIKAYTFLVWQDKATSTVPVLERQIISSPSGAPTTMGTGGVVDRFDVISSYFGTQHQWSVTETEYGFAWFDMRKKAFVVFDAGVNEISAILGLKSFFDEIFVDVPGFNSSILNTDGPFINSPNFDETSDRPLVGTGITGVYDPKFKMTYMTFKFIRRIYDPNTTLFNNVSQDFTIGYYHPKKAFVGFYDWLPGIAHNHNQFVIAANNPKNLMKYYGPSMASTAFALGDIIGDGQSTYICTTAGTVGTYVTPPSGSLFTKLTTTNELWVNNQPSSLVATTAPDYIYNTFFGRVVNNELIFVINPKTGMPFYVSNIEQKVGSNVNYTDVEIDADGITAADNNISTTDRNYMFIYDRIASSLPLTTSTGRIISNYLRIRLVKKNWTTNPLTLTGTTKILEWVKSAYTEKQ